MNILRRALASFLFRLGYMIVRLSKFIGSLPESSSESTATTARKSVLIEQSQNGRCLYETPERIRLWLNEQSTIDRSIICEGVWEKSSTDLIKRLVQPGFEVLDVGANIGYYTTLMAKLVGQSGLVHAFEPTRLFGDVLVRNVQQNQLKNVVVHKFGLSDKETDLRIYLNDSTASMHMDTGDPSVTSEIAHFISLDHFVEECNPKRLDFIKIDVDGHEPLFLKGAEASIRRFRPMILLEINHLDYLAAGVTAWDFYEYVRSMDLHIYNIDTTKEIRTKSDFLKQCGNFGYQIAMDVAFSRNILLSPRQFEGWPVN